MLYNPCWGSIGTHVARCTLGHTLTAHALSVQQGPYSTNLLIAGWDKKMGPSLFWMDYLATMHSMNIAGTGYGADSTQFMLCCARQQMKPALSISTC